MCPIKGVLSKNFPRKSFLHSNKKVTLRLESESQIRLELFGDEIKKNGVFVYNIHFWARTSHCSKF